MHWFHVSKEHDPVVNHKPGSLDKRMSRMDSCVPYGRRFLVELICVGLLVVPVASNGAELKEETVKTWNAYIQTTNSQLRDRVHGPFLWVDEVPDRAHRVHAGQILVSSVGQQNPKSVPSGSIHDWMGAAFIPGARLEDVLSVVRDYDHYKEIYKPTVVDSGSLGTDGAEDKYSMVVVNKQVIETALDSEYAVRYFQVDERRWYSIAYTTRVQEIRHYGQSGEQELPPNQGNGYIWRLYSLARFEERDGGVYVELEAIALSRDIPFAVRWIVNPIVRSISKNSLLTSLRQLEDAVHPTAGIANRTAKPSTVGPSIRSGAIASAR